MKTPSFSVIIPTRDRPDALRRCLDSLASADYSGDDLEIVVVDDSGNASGRAVAAAFGEQLNVRYIESRQRGPAAARNAGVRVATGSTLAFTDDDCAVDSAWFNRIECAMSQNPGAIIGGKVVNRLAANRYAGASQHLQDFLYRWYHEERGGDLRFFTSNNMAMTRCDFDRIGGFDESFPFASEDRDLSDRALHAGIELVYAPDAAVYHSHDLGLSGFLKQHFRYGRGAAHFHRRRSRRRSQPVSLEPPEFYYAMLTFPFSASDGGRALESLLLVASQGASFFGYVHERIQQRSV